VSRRILGAGLALALGLGGCQSFSLEDYAKAANTLDPECGKKVHLELTPIIMGFWVIPVIGGSYDKSCNPDQFDGSQPSRAPLIPGKKVGG
jgi:hypothetical protein